MKSLPPSFPRRHGLLALPLVLLALLGATTTNLRVGAADPAPVTGSIPYNAVADVYDGFAKTKDKDKLRVAVRITPAKGHTRTSPLAVEIRSREGTLPIEISPSGELLNFPLTPALRAENPRMVSNQPKGSLALEAELAIRYPGRLNEYAAWYLDALAQANAAVNAQAGLLKHLTPRLKALVFHFAPTQPPASIRLQTDAGEKALVADEEGKVRVELGPEANRRGARLILPAEPRRITAE